MSSSSEDQPVFTKRKYEDLLKHVPKCRSHQMVESINSVFDLLEDKLSNMACTMTNLATHSIADFPEKKVHFGTAEVAQKMTSDCLKIRELMTIQMQKLEVLKRSDDGKLKTVSQMTARHEAEVLKTLFPGRKRKVDTPSSKEEPPKKIEKPVVETSNVDHLRKKIRGFMMFPAPIMVTSDFMREQGYSHRNPTGEVDVILEKLQSFLLGKVIHRYPNGHSVILKEFRGDIIAPAFERFGIDREAYMDRAVPFSIKDLKARLEGLDAVISKKVDDEMAEAVAELIVATLVKDDEQVIVRSLFPSNLPKSFQAAAELLNKMNMLELTKEGILKKRRMGVIDTINIERRFLGRFGSNTKAAESESNYVYNNGVERQLWLF